MEKTCEFCLKHFEAKRSTAKYCSPKCRVDAARFSEKPTNSVTVATLDFVPAKDHKKTDRVPNPFVEPVPGQRFVKKDPNPFAASNRDPNYDAEKALAAFQKMGLAKVEWLSTGIPEFDALTQIPRGRITQIQGPYGVGKTTLCLNMIAGMKGQKVLYIDSEASLNPELLKDLQIDPKYFELYNESAYLEDIVEKIKEAAKSGKYDVVVFDSLASVTTKAETEGNVTDRNIGQKAFFTHKLIHMTQMDFKNTNTAFVVINQEREVIGSYVPQKYTPGGNAVPYAASLIVALKTIKSWRFPKDPKDKIYQGHEVEATILKSKVNQPHRVAKFKLYYPNPVVTEGEVQGEPLQPAF